MAGGFMAGFGSSFSKSFEAGNQRTHEKRQDAFKMAYDSWTRKKASYDEDEKKWKENLRAGEAIASRYGAPPGASLKAAEWLAAGYTTKEVDEMVKNTQFSMVTPESPKTNVPEAPTAVDGQMEQSGLATPAEIAQPEAPIEERNPASQDGDLLAGMFGPEGMFKNAGKSDEERASTSVRETAGVSEEEFNAVNKGFSPPPISGVNALATNTLKNPLEEFGLDEQLTDSRVGAVKVAVSEWEKSDDPTAKAKAARFRAMEPMIDAQLAAQDEDDPAKALKMNDILKNTDSNIAPISEARGTAFTLAQHGLELDGLVQAHPEILSFTGTTAAGIESAKTEVTNLIDFVFENGGATESSLSAALDRMEDDLIGGGKAPAVASAYRQFVAASFRYSYAAAAALGSSGRDLSDKELEMIKDAILVSNNADDFSKNLRRFAKERWSSIDSDIDALKRGNPQVAFALKDKDAGPFVKDALMPMSEFYKDGKFGDVVKWMNGEVAEKIVAAPNPQQTAVIPPGIKPKPSVGAIEIDDETGDEYRFVGGDERLPESWELLPNRNGPR